LNSYPRYLEHTWANFELTSLLRICSDRRDTNKGVMRWQKKIGRLSVADKEATPVDSEKF
jgi:hypothetical protein